MKIMRNYYKSLQIIVSLGLLFLPTYAYASSEIQFSPDTGYFEEEFEINVVVEIPVEDRVSAFEFEVPNGSRFEIDSYKELDPGCMLDAVKSTERVKVFCMAELGSYISGVKEVMTLKIVSQPESEVELAFENVKFGSDSVSTSSLGSYRISSSLSEVDDPTIPTESEGFAALALDFIEDNYLVILVSLITILATVVAYNLFLKKKRYPSQMKMFSIMMVTFASVGVFVAIYLLRDSSFDTRSRAGVDTTIDIPIFTEYDSDGTDLNGDGVVDELDVEIFTSDFRDWKETKQYWARSDFNNDRVIDAADFEILHSEE